MVSSLNLRYRLGELVARLCLNGDVCRILMATDLSIMAGLLAGRITSTNMALYLPTALC